MNYRELKEDEYYVGEWDGNKKCIFIHSRYKETPGIDTTNIFSFDKIWCSGGNINFRTPTLEEKHWLDVCIKENKSIPYEEAFKTFKQNVQTNEEYILEEAKIKYPIGTKFYPIFVNTSDIYTITDNNFTFHNNNTSITVSTNLGNGSIVKNGCSIYHNGKWAEIIELPKEQTEFKKGDYIVYTEDSDNDGFRFNYCYKQKLNEKYLCPEITDKGSVNNGWIYINIIKDNWRYATLKEIAEYDRIGKPYDVTTLNQKELSIQEIQEECKRRFPIGCTFKNSLTDTNYTIKKDDIDTYKIIENQYIDGGFGKGCLYYEGAYAEVVSLPVIENIPEYVEYIDSNRGDGVYQSHLKLIKKHSNTTIKEQVDVSSPKVTNEITIPKINTKTLDRLLHINAEIKTTMVTVPKIEVKKSVIKNIQVNVLKSLTI